MTVVADNTATSGATQESRLDQGAQEVSNRLIASAARLSRNAMTEVDWDAPVDPTKYGCSPEWCTLYGTDLWNSLDEKQQIELTKHETASVASNGIWFEMILQEMVLRDQYLGQYHSPEFQFALTEVADECRHSIMFAKASEKMVGTSYKPTKKVGRLGKLFKRTAKNEVAYAGI
ncbi:MAG: diiron oxygenase, partial [Mycobacterium sp.]|nr:diiron oxygenase [Mycobacterium sp.]